MNFFQSPFCKRAGWRAACNQVKELRTFLALQTTTTTPQPNLKLNPRRKRRILPLCNLSLIDSPSYQPLISLLSTKIRSINIHVTLSNRYKICHSQIRHPPLPPSLVRLRNFRACLGQTTRAILLIFLCRCGRELPFINCIWISMGLEITGSAWSLSSPKCAVRLNATT